ncbi:hypothetical protein [Nocardia sp. NBC_01388]|uniref:hypothetical protein n=1 Tax=Nocardia sp. NBC_01388 TaxID=2903596 RepID=UPI003244F216
MSRPNSGSRFISAIRPRSRPPNGVVHQCLGQNLARLELEIILAALFDRIPTLRLAVPVDRLTLRPGTTIQGVNELPVTW